MIIYNTITLTTEPAHRPKETYLNTRCFRYKVANGVVPDLTSELFTRVHEVGQNNTKQSQDFHVLLFRSKASRRSFSYKGPILWRGIPDDIKLRPSLPSFERAYKRYLLLKQYNPLCKQSLSTSLLCPQLPDSWTLSMCNMICYDGFSFFSLTMCNSDILVCNMRMQTHVFFIPKFAFHMMHLVLCEKK